jgi:hypothetical protein
LPMVVEVELCAGRQEEKASGVPQTGHIRSYRDDDERT